MDSRTRFAIGGVSTVVASVAVVCAVALTNSAALVETAGATVAAGPVVVPNHIDAASPSDAPSPSATTPSVRPTPASPTVRTRPSASTSPSSVAQRATPSAPVVVVSPPPAARVLPASADAAVAQALATGSWDPVRDWAANAGWTTGRINAWIKRLESQQGSLGGQSLTSGAVSKNSVKADKDQSRDSPVRRD